MARLSVNLNKIALLRNSRRTGVPDLLAFARLAYEAGAQGITIHPRPDERHIRGSDVPAIAELMRDWRPHCELNIEGYPDERLFKICEAVRPEQCTLVPDGPGVLTSEEGWKLDNRDTPLVNPAVARLRRLGARVILFVDPDPGPVLANYGLENLRFLTPVYPGDELTVTLTCKQIIPREDAAHGEVRWDTDVTNQDGASVAKYDLLTMVAKQWPPAGAGAEESR